MLRVYVIYCIDKPYSGISDVHLTSITILPNSMYLTALFPIPKCNDLPILSLHYVSAEVLLRFRLSYTYGGVLSMCRPVARGCDAPPQISQKGPHFATKWAKNEVL